MQVVYSDANDTSYMYDGYVVEHGKCVAHAQWTTKEVQQSSPWFELSTVYHVLLSVVDKLVNAWMRWLTDN